MRLAMGHGAVYQFGRRSEEHTSELQSQSNLVCRLLLEKKTNKHVVIIDSSNEIPGNDDIPHTAIALSPAMQDPTAGLQHTVMHTASCMSIVLFARAHQS